MEHVSRLVCATQSQMSHVPPQARPLSCQVGSTRFRDAACEVALRVTRRNVLRVWQVPLSEIWRPHNEMEHSDLDSEQFFRSMWRSLKSVMSDWEVGAAHSYQPLTYYLESFTVSHRVHGCADCGMDGNLSRSKGFSRATSPTGRRL